MGHAHHAQSAATDRHPGKGRRKTYARLNFMALRNTFTANFLDACAISLPATAAGEPPVGFSLMAPAGRDHGLLTIAAAIEDVLSTR